VGKVVGLTVSFVLVLFALLCSGCSPEYAQSASVEIFTPIVHWVFAIIAPVVLALFGAFLSYLKKKHGWEMSAQMKEMLDGLIDQGIAYADEQAKKALKKTAQPLPSGDKLKAAVEFVATQIDDMGLPQKGGDALAKLIEAKLNTERHAMRMMERDSLAAKIEAAEMNTERRSDA
jgi:hypothetical protein